MPKRTDNPADPKRTAYSQAIAALRDENPARFKELLAEKMAANGITDWHPRPSATEKAQSVIDQLLAEHPELAEVYQRQTA